MEVKGEKGKVVRYRVNIGTGSLKKVISYYDYEDDMNTSIMEHVEAIRRICKGKTMQDVIKAIKAAEKGLSK